MKAFSRAKLRLAPALAPGPRAALARSMATQVLEAARPLPTAVVCDDLDVAAWATANGARVVWTPGLGLDGAVVAGVRALAMVGARCVVVAHGDLPLAADLSWVAAFDGVTLVPDHRDNGTNVICVPTAVPFPFSYGPGSFSRHATAARRMRLPLRIVRDPLLASDVDVPADLRHCSPARDGGRR